MTGPAATAPLEDEATAAEPTPRESLQSFMERARILLPALWAEIRPGGLVFRLEGGPSSEPIFWVYSEGWVCHPDELLAYLVDSYA